VRVVVTDHVFADLDIERDAVAELGGELVLAPATDEATLVEEASHADALLVCYAPVGARVVEAAAGNDCKVIARYGIGVDNVDVAAATQAGIRVTNVPDYCVEEVADHSLALLLSCARQLQPGIDSVRAGGWELPRGRIHRIAGRRLALLGLGRIGRKVLERALPFGLEVVGYDPYLSGEVPGLARAETAAAAVADADFVSLHVPLTDETRHLIGDPLIGAMRKAPCVVNASRGGLVDTAAALRALDSGALSGLALDVTEEEPLPADSPLRNHPKVIVTPHMAFYSVEAERELQRRAVEEVVRALRGEPAVSAVN
jgi:D-3-phosphoglycerate dehydrogenase / 2-oxoglutarate reductase